MVHKLKIKQLELLEDNIKKLRRNNNNLKDNNYNQYNNPNLKKKVKKINQSTYQQPFKDKVFFYLISTNRIQSNFILHIKNLLNSDVQKNF